MDLLSFLTDVFNSPGETPEVGHKCLKMAAAA
jgi:hypothetical protein